MQVTPRVRVETVEIGCSDGRCVPKTVAQFVENWFESGFYRSDWLPPGDRRFQWPRVVAQHAAPGCGRAPLPEPVARLQDIDCEITPQAARPALVDGPCR